MYCFKSEFKDYQNSEIYGITIDGLRVWICTVPVEPKKEFMLSGMAKGGYPCSALPFIGMGYLAAISA